MIYFFLLIKNSCHNKINIGFIEFIVYPTMELCGDLIERVYEHLNSSSSSSSTSTTTTVTATATTMATTSVDIIEEEEDNDDQKSSNDNEDDLKPKQQQQISRNSSTTTTTNSSATVITTTTPVFNMVINSSTRKLYRPWLQYLDQNKTKWQQKATLEGIILDDQTNKKKTE